MRKLTSMTTLATLTAACLMVSGVLVRAADTENGKNEQRGQLSRKDYKFVREAAEGGMLEVRLGELAKQKGSTPAVQQFGDQMVKDHTKANDELKALAEKKGAGIPTQLGRKEENEIERLQKLAGNDFDKSYAEHMVKDHKKDVKEFQDAAKGAEDAELKAFAEKTLPILEHHSQMAQEMESSVKQAQP